MAGARQDRVWTEVMVRMGHASGRSRRAVRGESRPSRSEAVVTAQDGDGGVCGVASGFRSGRHYAAEQSFPWTRHLCCDMGCGVRADLQHVTLGWCAGMMGADVYRAHVRTCLAALLKRIPKPREPTVCTPMCEWQCPARIMVITAQKAMREELQARGWASEWSAAA